MNNWIEKLCGVKVMIFSSSSVDTYIRTHHIPTAIYPALSLLQPFEYFTNISFNGLLRQYTIPRLSVTFLHPSQVCPVEPSAAFSFLSHVKISPYEFNEFRDTLLNSTSFSKVEYVHHPLGVFVFLLASDALEMKDFLRNISKSFPASFISRAYDSSILHYSVIVFDNVGLASDGQLNIRRIVSDSLNLPNNRLQVHILPFFSFLEHGGSGQEASLLWRSKERVGDDKNDDDQLSKQLAQQELCYISVDDEKRLRQVIDKCICEGILPHLTSVIFNLKTEINQARSGLRNQIKYLFGKSKSKGADSKE